MLYISNSDDDDFILSEGVSVSKKNGLITAQDGSKHIVPAWPT